MNRRTFVGSIMGALLAGPVAVRAQQTGRIYRIGYLNPVSQDDAGFASVRQALAGLGYVADKNTVFEARFANGNSESLPILAAELVAAKVEIIIAAGPLAIRAAQAETSTIPIIMAVSGDDPVKVGFVSSLARPGGNITGFTFIGSDLAPKLLELLREASGARKIAILCNAVRTGHAEIARDLETFGSSRGVQLDAMAVRDSAEYSSTFMAMTRQRDDAIMILPDPMFTRDAAKLADLATKHALPSIYTFSEYPAAGGLMSYGPHHFDWPARAAVYVDKILHGANPGELPVQQPTIFDLVINLKTAKALGLVIPRSLLQRAAEVIR